MRKIVVVRHVSPQAAVGRRFRIPRHQLLVPAIDGEVERIAWVLVDELQVGVGHRQLAKRKLTATPVNVVLRCRRR
jgi:hypothetical protein